jgi:hypothetical protein
MIFLQSIDLTNLFFYLIGLIGLFALQVLIIRWIFQGERQLKNQSATIWFLIKLCENSGVPPASIQEIRDIFHVK